ncbi:alpha/beta hydrolase [Neobacillus rhizophilus]|uniref:Alpha/beta hydrolase n=1 Tax=Neobacillus rhizophilus TaxID=2833579 RepID=A0A942U548_9BACI|nr:alpha/beta hydrolase [Neobacillus rhizophilus]MBS4211209.1 alpha/beta hydrolase [Neobacillus rhizophilus]MBU8918733.1 alpha/beta hydrolase [Bacillus sp. FJAT-29953]
MVSSESLMIRQMLKASLTNQLAEFNLEATRNGLEALSALTPVAPDINVEKKTIEGIPAEWVTAPNAEEDRVFLYLHGGAYIMGSCNTHRYLASKLSRSTRARVLVPEYRLAPENPYPAAVEDALKVYRWLVDSGVSPEKIIIGGDSAGGGLTMSTLLALREAGDKLPALTVLLSPWTDLEGTGESMETRRGIDPWLNPDQSRLVPALYIRDLDPRDPHVSPIYADLTGLPPMLVHAGNDEILLDDSIRLVDRALAAGVDVSLKIWDDMWHVFQTFNIPEGQQDIDEIGEFVVKRLGL